MQPHQIVPWQTAVTLLFNEKIEVLEEYGDIVRSPSIAIQVPAVARLTKGMSQNKRSVKFSRVNVLTRDKFVCQYCGCALVIGTVTYDHVVPKSQGGKTVWKNVVSACKACNSRKAGRTPEQARMKLRSMPVKPKSLPMTLLHPREQVQEVWRSYLQV
jgi:5-methylcytosine-specific restriction endonuclease McrA